MSIISPLILKTIARTISTPDRLPFLGASIPPIQDKLIAWLPGTNLPGNLKKESVSGFNFTIANCPGFPVLDGDGDPVFDDDGDPVLDGGFDTTGWKCEYQAPVQGQPGYTELIAIDDGTLYGSGSPQPPNVLTKAILAAIDSDQMFFADRPGRGFVIYDSVLTGLELTDIENWLGNAILSSGSWDDDGVWVDDVDFIG